MKSRISQLESIVSSQDDLAEAIIGNPSIIHEQDEEGRTLLHYAAVVGRVANSMRAREILGILFSCKQLNFALKDSNQNTPLHIAANACKERVTCETVFPAMVEEASNRGYDFATLDGRGQSVLHIATRVTYEDPRGLFRKKNNVLNVLHNADNPGLDVMSSSGSTALFYAINCGNFFGAEALIAAGANPYIYGSIERSPFYQLDKYIEEFTEKRQHAIDFNETDKLDELIRDFSELKNKLYEKAISMRDFAEIRKCARIVAQGVRGLTLFTGLPGHLLTQIVSEVRAPNIRTAEEAAEIARTHFNKPTVL